MRAYLWRVSTLTIEIRLARPDDAGAITAVHDAAWRNAYRGIIPGKALEAMVERRGPTWWARAIERRTRIIVLSFGGTIAGYASYGRNRASKLPFGGEIFELYVMPEFQGIGLGKRLFNAVRRDLAGNEIRNLVVWALADNEQACGFYRRLGGHLVDRSSERFDDVLIDKLAFAWPASTA